MAEIAAGAIGAIGSVVAAAQSTIAGFSNRHDHNLDAQVAETGRYVEAFNSAYRDGEIEEADYDEFQELREAYVF